MTTNEDLMRAIGGLEANVHGARADIAELKDETSNRFEGHSGRLRSLEGSRSTGKGVLITVSTLAGAIGLERLAYYLTGMGS